MKINDAEQLVSLLSQLMRGEISAIVYGKAGHPFIWDVFCIRYIATHAGYQLAIKERNGLRGEGSGEYLGVNLEAVLASVDRRIDYWHRPTAFSTKLYKTEEDRQKAIAEFGFYSEV